MPFVHTLCRKARNLWRGYSDEDVGRALEKKRQAEKYGELPQWSERERKAIFHFYRFTRPPR